jgi:hypothetical protein
LRPIAARSTTSAVEGRARPALRCSRAARALAAAARAHEILEHARQPRARSARVARRPLERGEPGVLDEVVRRRRVAAQLARQAAHPAGLLQQAREGRFVDPLRHRSDASAPRPRSSQESPLSARSAAAGSARRGEHVAQRHAGREHDVGGDRQRQRRREARARIGDAQDDHVALRRSERAAGEQEAEELGPALAEARP